MTSHFARMPYGSSRARPVAPRGIDRRTFVQRLLWATAGGALAGCSGGGGTKASGPNVLMIAIDDLNDWVGFLGGHPQVKTPNMDRLAARSSVFRRAYCNAPVCGPSRASLLSGLSVQDTRVFYNETDPRVANPKAVVFPQWLGSQGYQTASYGKITHVYPSVTGPDPLPPSSPATNLECPGNGVPPIGMLDWAGLAVDDSAMPDYQLAQHGIDFLDAKHSKPFFLSVGFIRNHVAWYVPQKWFDLYPEATTQIPVVPANDLDDIPPAGVEIALKFDIQNCIVHQNLWASAVRGYLATISFVDAQIGRLLDALDASRYADDTVVILWSDHGFHLGEKFHWHKLALWERCTRIPFLISQPGQTSSANVDVPVSVVDLMPTALELCGGIDPPYALSGRSLVPLLSNPSTPWDHPVLTTKDQYDYAIRSQQWRYIRYANGDRELYDETADPNEWANVAEDPARAAIIAELDPLMPPRPA